MDKREWRRRFTDMKPHPVLIHRHCIAYLTLFAPEHRYFDGMMPLWWDSLLEDIEEIDLPEEIVSLSDPFLRFDEAMKIQSKEFLEQFMPYSCNLFLKELRDNIDQHLKQDDEWVQDKCDGQLKLPFEEFESGTQTGEDSADGRDEATDSSSTSSCSQSPSKNS